MGRYSAGLSLVIAGELHLKLVYDEFVVKQHGHDGDDAELAEQRQGDGTREPVLRHRRNPPEPVSNIV